jgi:nucleotidyltransferase-like protein
VTQVNQLAARLVGVAGIVAVTLGGSRARGTHTPDSDTDLGLYYRPPLDLDALQAVAGDRGQVTAPGEWGPWVDGGAWLTIDGAAVDWIYRDVDRVRRSVEDAEEGRYGFHAQTGHPLGVPDFTYAAELALGQILADPTGELSALRGRLAVYPRKLADRLIRGLWEADFLITVARKAVSRQDVTYVSGCLFRVFGVCAHALHGAAGAWLTNEKGAIAAAAGLPGAPPGFRTRVESIVSGLDPDPIRLSAALDAAADLVLDTADACAMMIR